MNIMYGANANSTDASSDTPGRSGSTRRASAREAPHRERAAQRHDQPRRADQDAQREHCRSARRELREHTPVALHLKQRAEELRRRVHSTGDAPTREQARLIQLQHFVDEQRTPAEDIPRRAHVDHEREEREQRVAGAGASNPRAHERRQRIVSPERRRFAREDQVHDTRAERDGSPGEPAFEVHAVARPRSPAADPVDDREEARTRGAPPPPRAPTGDRSEIGVVRSPGVAGW